MLDDIVFTLIEQDTNLSKEFEQELKNAKDK